MRSNVGELGQPRATLTRKECDRFNSVLSEAADGTVSKDPSATGHISTCLRCQAELAQYKKLLRALSNLRGQVLNPDEYLLHDILNALDQVGGRRHWVSTLVAKPTSVGGLKTVAATAGAAACTAGAIALASRLTARHRLAG